jgi:hypothetical protein
MSFYTCLDWFKKLRLFSNVRNLKIYVVLKASRAVVIRWFSLNEAPLGLFTFISDYLPYFEKINIFFNIITYIYLPIYYTYTCTEILLRIDRNYLFGSFEITSIRLYNPCVTRYAGYTVCITWLRLFLHEANKNCDQSLTRFLYMYMYNI